MSVWKLTVAELTPEQKEKLQKSANELKARWEQYWNGLIPALDLIIAIGLHESETAYIRSMASKGAR